MHQIISFELQVRRPKYETTHQPKAARETSVPNLPQKQLKVCFQERFNCQKDRIMI